MSDVYHAVQSALADHLEGMVIGFVAVVEEIDEAGECTLRVLRSDMTVWHAVGMLEYAKDEARLPLVDASEEEGEDFS